MRPTWLPRVGVGLFFATLCWRSWWQRRHYGSHGVILFGSRRWQEKLRAALGVVLFLSLLGQAVAAALSPQLLLPTRLSVALLIGAVIGVRQQGMTEEAYLVSRYGDAYRTYAHDVGRFVPRLGRLPS